jgi:hypothetical protein
MGLDFDVFYGLTWYEYILATKRFDHVEKQREHLEEMEWHRFRLQWASFLNANRNKGKIVTPEELIPLSFDSEKSQEKKAPLGSKKMKEMMGGTFKRDGSE